MSATQTCRDLVRFGLFELDTKTGELRRKGVKVHLQEQPFQVLAMLLERPGELVLREELRVRLWPESVFVDFDHGLNKAIGKVRQALGDLAESPRFVETLERRGYRFIAPVDVLGAAGLGARAQPMAGALRLIWDGRTISLGEGESLIGRDASAAVWVDSSEVSRRHAVVATIHGRVVVEDLGSKNGTFLNDRRLDQATALCDGDVIRVGPASLTFRSAPPSTQTRTAPD